MFSLAASTLADLFWGLGWTWCHHAHMIQAGREWVSSGGLCPEEGRPARLGTGPGVWRGETRDKIPVVGIRQLGQNRIYSQAIRPTRLP